MNAQPKLRVSLVLLFTCLTASLAVAQSLPAADQYIAKAGTTLISKNEFLSRFELLPGFGRHRASQLEGAKAELLYSMIAEKLLAEDAAAKGFGRDSSYGRAFLEVRKMLARDELYREEVIQKVHITNTQVSTGIVQALRQLLVAFMYFPKRDDAQFLRSQMKRPSDFEEMHIDSSISIVRDTATVIWGDADPAIQQTAYTLKPGEISHVVFASGGYYILKLKAVQRNNYFASLQPGVLHERVLESLRLRAEKARMEDFEKVFLKDKVGYSVSKTLSALADDVEWVCGAESDTMISFTPETAARVLARCTAIAADTLAVVGSAAWSVEDALNFFSSKGFRLRCGPVESIFHQLNTEMELLVRQELLAEEALHRGLDAVPDVKRRLDVWRQYYLSLLMKDSVKRSVTVTDAEIYAYLHAEGKLPRVPRVQIRELRTAGLDEMKGALDQLEQGSSLEEVIRRWSVDSAARSNGGVSAFFPVTEHPPIGELAWEMQVGQRFGPFSEADGAYYFELLAKDTAGVIRDTSAAAQLSDARRELLRMKQKRALDLYLAQTAGERGYAVYEDAFKKISVSPVPMMTFRILGFGGRMFEVPFVDKQIDWLNIEPPGHKILP